MKFSICILAVSLFSYTTYAAGPNEYVRAANVKMSAKDCESLAGQVSIKAFSPDTNSSYVLLKLNKGKSVDFFNTTRKQIDEKLSAYCKDDKSLKTIDDFQGQFQSSCAPTCDANLDKFYKDSILGPSTEKNNAEIICLSICNKSSESLEFLKTGARLAEAQPKAAASDCTGAVSDQGRNIDVKTFIIEDKKNQRIRNATDAER